MTGLCFWKVGSRKIYALLETSIKSTRRTKRSSARKSPICRYNLVSSDNDDYDDDDLDETPFKKKSGGSNSRKLVEKISSDINKIRDDLESVFKLTKDTKLQ